MKQLGGLKGFSKQNMDVTKQEILKTHLLYSLIQFPIKGNSTGPSSVCEPYSEVLMNQSSNEFRRIQAGQDIRGSNSTP